MKFFDYKFLILLGLTLATYFIYREVNHLHTKVQYLEENIKTIKTDENKKNNNLELNIPKIIDNKIDNIIDNKIDNKIDNIIDNKINNINEIVNITDNINEIVNTHIYDIVNNMPIKNVNNNSDMNNHTLSNIENMCESKDIIYSTDNDINSLKIIKLELPTMNNIMIMNEEELLTDTSDDSKHLEIYSNDNEDNSDSDIICSVDDNDKNLHCSKLSEENINTINELLLKKNILENENKETSEKEVYDKNINNEEKNKSKYDENNLRKLSLPELKKLAEDNEILLNKEGSNKLKTKNELIKEILSKK